MGAFLQQRDDTTLLFLACAHMIKETTLYQKFFFVGNLFFLFWKSLRFFSLSLMFHSYYGMFGINVFLFTVSGIRSVLC